MFINYNDKLENIKNIQYDSEEKVNALMEFLSEWVNRVENHISDCECEHSDFEGRGFGHFER